jgi:DNA gyrase subunit B
MTDADVDGAHIRTLLLTFFYRQMPDIITNGHLFIAQPPLYKAAKGRSEVYLKDDAALDDYLVDAGVGLTVLEANGAQRTGADLRMLVDHARRMKTLMRYAPRRYDQSIIETLAMGGALDPEASREVRAERLAAVAARLDSTDADARWTARMTEEGGFHFERVWRGVTDHHIIDAAFVASAEGRKLHALAAEVEDEYRGVARLVPTKGAAAATEPAAEGEDEPPAPTKGETQVARPSQLLDAILAAGRKGLSIQRYKGLGEMNAEQLWETTLDPQNRSMLRVAVDQADVADAIFTQLMGDVVEPRRDFIQQNALNVANLDV